MGILGKRLHKSLKSSSFSIEVAYERIVHLLTHYPTNRHAPSGVCGSTAAPKGGCEENDADDGHE
jgi:hypothetical protein